MSEIDFTEDELYLVEDWAMGFLDSLDGYRYEADLARSILEKVDAALDD